MNRKPWRAGWLGKLLGRHSITSELTGECWCQKSQKKPWTVGQSFMYGVFKVEMEVNRKMAIEKNDELYYGVIARVNGGLYISGEGKKTHSEALLDAEECLCPAYDLGVFGVIQKTTIRKDHPVGDNFEFRDTFFIRA